MTSAEVGLDAADDGVTFVGGPEAFYYDGVSARLVKDSLEDDHGLDLTGWTLTYATGVAADGQIIAGQGTNPLGQSEGWVASLCGIGSDNDGDGIDDGCEPAQVPALTGLARGLLLGLLSVAAALAGTRRGT